MQLCSVEQCTHTLPRRHLESNWRCAPSSRNPPLLETLAWSSAPWDTAPCFMRQSCIVSTDLNTAVLCLFVFIDNQIHDWYSSRGIVSWITGKVFFCFNLAVRIVWEVWLCLSFVTKEWNKGSSFFGAFMLAIFMLFRLLIYIVIHDLLSFILVAYSIFFLSHLKKKNQCVEKSDKSTNFF